MKVLVVGMSDNKGGIEQFIYNYTIGFNEVDIDFLVTTDNIVYEKEFSKKGYKIRKVVSRKTNYFRHIKQVDELLRFNNYDAVWLNVVSLSYLLPIKLAKKHSVPIRIVHSHSSSNLGGAKSKFLHFVNSKSLKKNANHFWSCSKEGAEFLFKNLDKTNFRIVKNAIDVEKFEFSEYQRKKLQMKYDLKDKFIVGHVGRLSKEKNHLRLIEIFKEGLYIMPNALLFLVGGGEENKNIQNYIQKLNLNDKVYMLGPVYNVSEFMSLFDVFVLPSTTEGLAISLIEAQTNGLRCFASKGAVPKEPQITNLLEYIDLSKSNEYWASKIFKSHERSKKSYKRIVTSKGYNIKIEAQKLEELFLGLENNRRKND